MVVLEILGLRVFSVVFVYGLCFLCLGFFGVCMVIETPFLLVLLLRSVVMIIRPLKLLDPERAPLGFCCSHV